MLGVARYMELVPWDREDCVVGILPKCFHNGQSAYIKCLGARFNIEGFSLVHWG